MAEKFTHIKKLRNPEYIGSYELLVDDNQAIELPVTISGWKREEVKNGDKKEFVTVLQLKDQKPFILNVTNEDRLTKLFGTPFVEKWVGRQFTLCVEVIRVKKQPTYALRVKTELPKTEMKDFGPDNPKWNEAIEALKKGNTTVEALKKTRTLTPENEEILKKAEADSLL